MSNDASSYMRKSGVILAEVTNIKDPDNLNRLKCKPVTADKDVGETDWCFCMAPMGGQGYGQFFFPKVGDLVLLTYLGGDVHHPIVLGSYWANDIKAPYSIKDGVNEIRCIKTPAGIEIKLEDTEKKEKLTLTTPSGAMLQLDDENKSLALQDKNGENKLTILWEKGEITLAASPSAQGRPAWCWNPPATSPARGTRPYPSPVRMWSIRPTTALPPTAARWRSSPTAC